MADRDQSLHKSFIEENNIEVEKENVALNSRSSKVDLNNLIKKVKEEEKRAKRQNIVISAAALSVVAVFGIILTL